MHIILDIKSNKIYIYIIYILNIYLFILNDKNRY